MEKRKVSEMFDRIAPRYDFLNRLLSAGIDKIWRRKLVRKLAAHKPSNILDMATGTADLAIACAAIKPSPDRITGIDVSAMMLEKGREKVSRKGLDKIIELRLGDGENTGFDDCSFDAVTVAFGIRNFENPVRGLNEMYRVLRPGGRVYILEFTMPRNTLMKVLYKFYFLKILPFVGRMFSGHSSAYGYLPDSVTKFPQYDALTDMMRSAGFSQAAYSPLTFGVATIYTGVRIEN
jgi:demethylmenaquinone methyltransferase/2-methoxy-6-polyprenyl-1,4-benzoquinol methylase